MTDPKKSEKPKKNKPGNQDIPVNARHDMPSGKTDGIDEKYQELENFCENDPLMQEVEEQAAKEIETASRKLRVSGKGSFSDIYIEPTHKEKLAKTIDNKQTENTASKAIDNKLTKGRGLRGKNPEGRGVRIITPSSALEDKAAEALSSYRWLFEKASRFAKSTKDDQLLDLLIKIDKGMQEEDYVSLVLAVGEIEIRYADKLPEELQDIMVCLRTYVAALDD